MTKKLLCEFCHNKSNLKEPLLMFLADGKSQSYKDSLQINPDSKKLEVKTGKHATAYKIKVCPVCGDNLC